MARVPPALRQALFRDDCHFLDPGAAFAAAAICASLQALVRSAAHPAGSAAMAAAAARGTSALPPPLHARPWGRGRAEEVTPRQLSFFYSAPPSDPAQLQVTAEVLLQC